MSRAYDNATNYLNSIGFEITSTKETFYDDGILTYTCPDGHEMKLKKTSYINLKSATTNRPQDMCNTCARSKKNVESFEDHSKRVLEKTGHTLLKCFGDRIYSYKCGNCSEIGKTYMQNLLINRGTCPKCKHDAFKNDVSEIEKEMLELGHVFVDYDSNKKVTLKCPRGHTFEGPLTAIRKGQGCGNLGCMNEKRVATTRERYGVDNVSQSEHVKHVTIQTNLNKRGETHHMKTVESVALMQSHHTTQKIYVFKNGEQRSVLGYENHALLDLENSYTPDQIITDVEKMPKFRYTNAAGKESVYYPDIQLPDRFVEVKGNQYNDAEREKTDLKCRAVRDQGHTIEVWVYRNTGKLIEKTVYRPNRPIMCFDYRKNS